MKHIISVLLALSLASCASFHLSDEEWDELVQLKIQEWDLPETKRIRTVKLRSFSTLGEHHMIIREGANQAYLLAFVGQCYEADWASQITAGNDISAGFDSIYVGKSPQVGCRIERIYKLSRKQDLALTNLEHDAREQHKQASTSA